LLDTFFSLFICSSVTLLKKAIVSHSKLESFEMIVSEDVECTLYRHVGTEHNHWTSLTADGQCRYVDTSSLCHLLIIVLVLKSHENMEI